MPSISAGRHVNHRLLKSNWTFQTPDWSGAYRFKMKQQQKKKKGEASREFCFYFLLVFFFFFKIFVHHRQIQNGRSSQKRGSYKIFDIIICKQKNCSCSMHSGRRSGSRNGSGRGWTREIASSGLEGGVVKKLGLLSSIFFLSYLFNMYIGTSKT